MFSAEKTIDSSPDIVISFEWQFRLISKYEKKEDIIRCVDFLPSKGFVLYGLNMDMNGKDLSMFHNTLTRIKNPKSFLYREEIEIIATRDPKRFSKYSS